MSIVNRNTYRGNGVLGIAIIEIYIGIDYDF